MGIGDWTQTLLCGWQAFNSWTISSVSKWTFTASKAKRLKPSKIIEQPEEAMRDWRVTTCSQQRWHAGVWCGELQTYRSRWHRVRHPHYHSLVAGEHNVYESKMSCCRAKYSRAKYLEYFWQEGRPLGFVSGPCMVILKLVWAAASFVFELLVGRERFFSVLSLYFFY